jgi:hypothetical protein
MGKRFPSFEQHFVIVAIGGYLGKTCQSMSPLLRRRGKHVRQRCGDDMLSRRRRSDVPPKYRIHLINSAQYRN